MLDAEILKAAPQFEVPSGLPEKAAVVLDDLRDAIKWERSLNAPAEIAIIAMERAIDTIAAIAAIPAMVEEIGRLRKERGHDAEMARGALDAIHELLDDGGVPRGTFADDHVRNLVAMYNSVTANNESLRALNAELRQQLIYARSILRTFGGEEADATETMRGIDAILAKYESATTQPRIPGLPAQAPSATSTQPAPGGIIETEKSNDAG